ncbi:uracil-DNA glycosylase [Frigoriglobus tundricola]|uniref:Type-4 uracil-DNA glycosylase n=1 Tax=Frigoriglobus tundricola TaxID=2774151 RepID=A0A6M5YYK6_9BACT|nr:uracil-DNA glycosylase [Frigoriglobus tundricola]QJW98550.1 Uracil-DNA glycosylase, family 4 [Frigoriglobus tundricola]
MSADGSIDLTRQVRAHLESLRAAGVLFVPRGAAIALPGPAQPRAGAVPAVARPEPPVDPLEVRRQELTVLSAEVAACDKCSELFSTRTAPVFGTGPLDAEVAFIGAAPGAAEDAQGEPFVGTGGQLLSRIIAACGFTRETVYLFNVIKCRPPKNRAPTRTECENCRGYFRRQYELVKPKHLVALGEFTARLLTGRRDALAALRGKLHEYRGVPLVCTHHPDDIETDKTGKLKPETWEDLKLLLQKMGRPVAAGKRE